MWNAVRCGSKNWHQITICSKEIGLRAQKYAKLYRLNSQHEWGGIYMTLNEPVNLHFDDVLNIHMSSRKYEANGFWQNIDLLIILH